jgi:Fur family ferric uptake transcriptional regulator
MSTPNTELAIILRNHGFSRTKQRHIVFNLLLNREPMTINELYKHADKQLDRASIYRTVALFEELGIVSRITIGWKYKIELSDIFTEHHHHLSCRMCHAIIPINKDELEQFIARLAKENHFTPLEHQVEIQGYCQSCADKQTVAN